MCDRPEGHDASETRHDRRAESRLPATNLGEVSARVVGGSEVSLLNYASRSIFFESNARLLLGARISVRLATAALNAVVSGRVVRASLTRIIGGVPRYDVALALEEEVAWPSVPAGATAATAPVSELTSSTRE